jgi:hypothetical protein
MGSKCARCKECGQHYKTPHQARECAKTCQVKKPKAPQPIREELKTNMSWSEFAI